MFFCLHLTRSTTQRLDMQLFCQPAAVSWMKLSRGSWLVTFVWVKHPISPLDSAKSFWSHSSRLSVMPKGSPVGSQLFCCWRQGIHILRLSRKHWHCEWGLLGVILFVKRSSFFWLLPSSTAQIAIAKRYKIWPSAIYDRVLQGSLWTKEHVKIVNAYLSVFQDEMTLVSSNASVHGQGLIAFHMTWDFYNVKRGLSSVPPG